MPGGPKKTDVVEKRVTGLGLDKTLKAHGLDARLRLEAVDPALKEATGHIDSISTGSFGETKTELFAGQRNFGLPFEIKRPDTGPSVFVEHQGPIAGVLQYLGSPLRRVVSAFREMMAGIEVIREPKGSSYGLMVIAPNTPTMSVQPEDVARYGDSYGIGTGVMTAILIEYGERLWELDRETYNQEVDRRTNDLVARYKAKAEYADMMMYQGIKSVSAVISGGSVIVSDGNHRVPPAKALGYPLIADFARGTPKKETDRELAGGELDPVNFAGSSVPKTKNYTKLLTMQLTARDLRSDPFLGPLYAESIATFISAGETGYQASIDNLRRIEGEVQGSGRTGPLVESFLEQLFRQIEFLERKKDQPLPVLDVREWTYKPTEKDVLTFMEDQQVVRSFVKLSQFHSMLLASSGGGWSLELLNLEVAFSNEGVPAFTSKGMEALRAAYEQVRNGSGRVESDVEAKFLTGENKVFRLVITKGDNGVSIELTDKRTGELFYRKSSPLSPPETSYKMRTGNNGLPL